MDRILLTGASGFVGAHVLRHLLTHTDAEIICPVTFRHKGIPPRLWESTRDLNVNRASVIMLDLTAPIDAVTMNLIGDVDYILNVASESHVDRSIETPGSFIRNNVDLIVNVLEFARLVRPKMVLQMSTDEVYGPAPRDHRHMEWEAIKPSNPYSASKAMQEAACFTYWRTYGVPVVITNTMNIIGEMQDPEKFVPKIIQLMQMNKSIPMHVSPEGIPGSRFYLHARNLADAWLFLMQNHKPQMYPKYTAPSRFNIVGDREVSNLEMIQAVSRYVGKKANIESVNFHCSRPGHDLRYALDGTRMIAAGWTAPVPFEQSLEKTVSWYLDNQEWLVS